MAIVLQLSDLHRSAEDPVGNAELIAALESDRTRWPEDAVQGPDLIVISGDLVQGVGLNTTDSDAQLEHQYADAGELLATLVDRFLGSDRSRLILVPGNHDVDWCTARSSMEVVGEAELRDIEHKLPYIISDPASPYRWSWGDRQLYRVVDVSRYSSRCRRFLDFRRDFYAGLAPDPLRAGSDLVFMEFPSLDMSVTGLSSWFGNDCYSRVGAFDPEMLAAAREAIAGSACGLHMAVWHHSTAGPPTEADFLDVQQIHRLIDYGFRIGLHGHHHRADAAVMGLKLPTNEELALVSAGSLAAGRRELPVGVHRQYSLLRIDPDGKQLRVHIREAISDLIFAASRRTELGGNSYVDLKWTATPRLPGRSAGVTAAVDDAYRAVAQKDLRGAWDILRALPPQQGSARRLLIDVLRELEEWHAEIAAIGEPSTQEELMMLIDAHCHGGETQQARDALGAYADTLNMAPDLWTELSARISVKEGTGER